MHKFLDIVPAPELPHDVRDVVRLVCDALEVGDHLENGGHVPEILRDGLFAEKDFQTGALDLVAELVDPLLSLRDLLRERDVVLLERTDGVVDLHFGEVRHMNQIEL